MKKITLHELFGIGKGKDLIQDQIINALLAYTDSFYTTWDRFCIAMVVCDFLEKNMWDNYYYGHEINKDDLAAMYAIFLINKLELEE